MAGTTYLGGPGGGGVVFSIDPQTGGERLIFGFSNANGGGVLGDGVIYLGGKLYGTNSGGGTQEFGTAFEIDPKTGKETVLHNFTGGADGGLPYGSLLALHGVLYGTTYQGGTNLPRHGLRHRVCHKNPDLSRPPFALVLQTRGALAHPVVLARVAARRAAFSPCHLAILMA